MIHFLVLLMQLVLPILTSGSSTSFSAEGRTEEPSASRCSLFGDAHIETFDESFYDFAGDCSYILATDCYKHSFTVLGNYQHGRRNGFSVYLGEYFDIRFSIDGTVTQGDKRISMPFASHGIHLENEAGYYKLSSEEHGFVVKIDISGNIQILLEDKHYNKTCGLCGDFNSFAEDDFRTQEGTLVKNSYDFANSWALDSEDEQCRRVSAPSSTCNISSDMADQDVMEKCQLLRTSLVFSRCHHQIDPEPFINLCEKDMCTCAQDMSCQCPTFLEYARSCAHQGVILDGWPEDSLCRPRCPVGMEYKECISPCAKTCQSLNINEVCRGQCVDGCSCPEGKLLDGDRCVDSSECSCIHSGRHHPPGSSISRDCNFCICRRGIWICSNEECPGECSVTGQSHFKSFDNKYFTFSGICQYLFAKDCEEKSFSVIIDTVQCADDLDAVCTRSASVRLKDMENSIIKMKHGGGISMNGQDIQIPLVQGALRIQHTVMSSVRLTYGEDLQIDWDGHGKLLVKLSPVYTERTCGLCGNYNGNQGDDFLTPSGMVEALVEDFGNAWKLNADCQDLLKQDSDPCSFNPRLAKYAEASCSILMSPLFEPCHHEVNPSPYLKNCHYDVCSCSDGKDCLCSAISSYATACARKDVLIKWREPDLCSMSCPEGQVYQQCGTPCNQTCRSLSYPDADCNDFCMEGCYCPPGQYIDEHGDCVPKSQCSCYYDGEIFQPDDVFSDHYTMCYCENGFMHCSTNRLPGAFLPDIYFANQPSSRIKRSLTCRPPMEKFICPPHNSGAQGIECAKTCQNYDLECVSHSCLSGCLCPKGMVRHETRCIALERCPCFHNGREYSTGQIMTKDCNTCVCRGRKWDCTTHVCDATCSVIGTAHYLTFDGLKYKFPGACQYVLVQDYCEDMLGTFRILISTEGCGFTRDKCSKRVTIFFENGEIELFNGNVNVKTPPRDETGFEVLKSGRYYILLLGKDISVSWDLAMGISVILTEDFEDRVCGLCGNFDGIQNNDLTSSNNQLEVDPVDFGNSWKVKPHCADVKKFNQGQTLITPLCNDNLEKQVMVENSCSILTSDVFSECRKLVNPEPYVDICIYDTCTCESIGDCACFCDAIAAYAHICAQKGAVVQWRLPTLCPQSCEHMNKQELEYQCEWRYNSCGPACPATCQHLEPVECPLRCVEGCHVHCPAGKILDELSQTCIDPQDCPVCILEGARISHGKKIFLNKDDLERCQSCLCEGKNLTCHACEPGEVEERPTPTPTPTPLPPDEMETGPVEYSCSKMMDLALLLDGSNKLSEQDFEVLKDFISGMMKKLHISQKKIRVSVLVYTTASNIYLGLKEIKPPYLMRRMVKNIKYTGGDVASIPEVLKYIIYHVFKKAPRTNAARIAMLFTASKSPGNINSRFRDLNKGKITVIPIGLGPHISREQINLIESQSPGNKAFIMNNVLELKDNKEIIIDYLCDLVPEEAVSFPPPTKIMITPPPEPKAIVPSVQSGVTRAGMSFTTKPVFNVLDVAFIVEGSEKVGERNFNISKQFIEQVVQRMDIGQSKIHITIIQYSHSVTVEYSFSEIQSKEYIIEKVRQIPYQGGGATNTGNALNYVSHHTFISDNGAREQAPRLVYMVTSNPSTDVITRVPKSINVTPIGIIPNANIEELKKISQPDTPIIITSYNDLIPKVPDLVLETCCSGKYIPAPTTSDLCHRPMDVMFLLDGSASVGVSEFEEMKSFIKAFIERSDISDTATHIAVLQYGGENTQEISWNMPQEHEKLLDMVDSIQQREKGPTRLGRAIDYALQHAMTEANGGRPTAAKIAVVLVSERSEDPVDAAARSANANRVAVFPVGIGDRYDEGQLRTLTGESATDRIIKLHQFENLPTMVTLDNTFVNKLCTEPAQECIDDDGNKRRAGDTWILSDRCHTVTCIPGGHTILENYRIKCENLPKPTCRNDRAAVKLEETCGCHWVCPCRCLGSSTRHIVTFDGLNFKLTGNCSYTMFQDKEHDIEVILHNGACSSTPKINCMNSVEVKHSGVSLKLSSDMTVAVNGNMVSLPYTNGQLDVAVYGAIMHEIRFSHLGHNLTFTPRNNEFTLELSPRSFSSKMHGLCGVCDENDGNDFMLDDGSVTSDSSTFIQEWTVKEPGEVCEVERESRCAEHTATKCSVLLSAQFEECHRIISPNMFYAACQENSCYSGEICEIISSYAHACRTNGICIDWRTSEFCVMNCPMRMIYNHCQRSCIKYCENGTNVSVCKDYPTEGCFCPDGQVTFNSNCVDEEVCTQCISEDGAHHQHMETWIPTSEPCKICICLDNRKINCTVRPCPTAQSVECGPCEVPRLHRDFDQCCPEYKCVCDLASCDLPPVPDCKDELQPVLTNPGECRPNYTCACKKEMCRLKHIPLCPPHRELTVRKTQCCDEYECTCSCTNLTVNCPSGYLSMSVTNDCGCVTTNCIPDRVCVHHGIVYPIGKSWDEDCTECLCTNMEDAVTGLRIVECHEKPCNKICHQGYTYIQQEGECCGKCQKTACEEPRFWSRGDVDARWHEVGTKWRYPFSPCVINECVRMNNEVFIQKMNVSCSQMDMPDCQVGTELRCDRIIDCCPSCYCEPVKGCVLNGTVIGVGKRLMVDLCTTCECTMQRGQFRQYRLECRKFSCVPCPKSYRMEEISGSCCGRCVQISCVIRLRNGRIMYLQPNETVQDGCDSHACKVNEKQEFIWERRVTGCPPFDSRRCLAEGGKIAKIDNTCCETCVEAECRPFVSRLKHININDCLLENEVLISYCEGKCQSSTKYTTQLDRWEDQCRCCTATQTEVVEVPLFCVNGTVVQHAVSSALACECLPRKCT
ncbi:PREDICTED: von Willebrand factor isoform X1 [Gavialis gangeticus]|uniref:von Willebrand factor isoform X1 n=2 Tax=Gavialis gangeticus TaxID=94835 RepID=UPI00092EFF6D|nr:PREDICTED: von Willebrand factor isoform X1 [Gavialis gangeticus]